MTFGSHPDPNQASYYSNITGFIRGDIDFYNITPQFLATSSANQTWRPFAETLMYGTNMTEVVQRSGSWNWMDTDKVALSVVEKNSLLSPEELGFVEQIALIHVRIFRYSLKVAIIEYFWNRATLSSPVLKTLRN